MFEYIVMDKNDDALKYNNIITSCTVFSIDTAGVGVGCATLAGVGNTPVETSLVKRALTFTEGIIDLVTSSGTNVDVPASLGSTGCKFAFATC